MEEISKLMAAYPALTTLFVVIGIVRLVNKPLFSIVRTVVQSTVTAEDDRILDRVESSWIYRAFSYVLDWTASVKLPK